MNEIHKSVILEDDVKIGNNNKILPNTILIGPIIIGNNNLIGPNVVIGSPGQDTRNPYYDSSKKLITIGDKNIIREFTAIQKPAYEDLTAIGNNVFLMQSVHIPHDALIDDNVTITPMVALAGITRVLKAATLSMGVTIHQRGVVGHYSIVGMGASTMKNVKPFSRYIPGKPLSVNNYSIEKFKFDNLKDEITNYVLNNVSPQSDKLKKIINEFEELHRISGRDIYQ
jgi:UDP-N-acetylglucosamine acyltransferase